jgi:CspA family cold shock protein
MSTENVVERNTETKTSGRVKWFNNSSGYGFITATDGDKTSEDVFVHHSALETGEQQYKYLVLGEYVEFEWSEVIDKESHKWQASNVTGINGGKLMCETHKEQRTTIEGSHIRPHKEQRATNEESHRRPRKDDVYNNHKFRRGPNSIKDNDGKEWMLIPKSESH